MKLKILPALLFLFITCSTGSCKNDRNQSGLDGSENIDGVAPERKKLIEELKQLGEIIHSGNENKIAGIFPFPLADTVISLYMDDEEFHSEYEKNGMQISKEMFLGYFPKISPQLMLTEFSRLFQELNPDSLRYLNIIEKKLVEPAEPCYRRYMITIEGNEIALQFGTNSNTNYTAKSAKEKEAMEEAGDACEFTSIWIFEFKNNKLQLVRQAYAG